MPKSTEAAALMKAIFYPVSYSTGLPQIEIPIYEIKLKDGTILPIKLMYHASGYKIDEVKQRIGIGWTLEAEPQISRSVNGIPDEDYFLTHFNHQNLINNSNQNRLEPIYGGYSDFQPDHFFYKLMNKSGSFISKSPVTGDSDTKKCFFTVPYDPITIYGFPNDGFSINDEGYQYSFTRQNSISRIKISFNSFTNYELTDYPTVYKANLIVSPLKEQIKFSYSNPTEYNSEFNKITRKTNTNSYSVWAEEPLVMIHSYWEDYQDGTLQNLGYGDYGSMVKLKTAYDNMGAQGERNLQFGALVKTTNEYLDEITKINKTDISLISNNGFRRVDTYIPKDEKYPGIPSEYKNNTIEKLGELKSILFPGGKIEFVDKLINADYKVLDYILIKDTFNYILKKIKFSTHIATNYSALLDKVCFVNAGDTTEYEYKFDYYPNKLIYSDNDWSGWNADNARPKLFMPMIYTKYTAQGVVKLDETYDPNKSMDNVYDKLELNDIGESDEYVPNIELATEHENFISESRNSLVLNRITYPTGGSCTFNYEPNRFSKFKNYYDENRETFVNRLFYYYPPGMRIKEIDYFDKADNLSSRRQYKYGKNEDGSGVPFLELKPEDFIITENKKFSDIRDFGISGLLVALTKEVFVQTYLTKPIMNPYYDVGTSILYNEVAEYYQTLNNKESANNIKTIYKYDTTGISNIRPYRYTYSVNNNMIYTPVVAYSLDQWKIGKLTSVEQWGLNAIKQPLLVSKKVNTYKTIHSKCMQYYYMPYSKTSQEIINETNGLQDYSFFWGRIKQKALGVQNYPNPLIVNAEETYSGMQVQDQSAKVLEEERDSTDGVVIIKKYLYNENFKHLNPIQLTVTGKDTTKIEYLEKYFYTGDNDNDAMSKNNILNTLISKERWKGSKMTFKLQNNYWYFNNGVALTNLNNTLGAYPAMKEVLVGQDNASIKVRLKYLNYDQYGNPVYVSKDDAINVVYLWSYLGQYPVAEIKNATYDEVVANLDISTTDLAASLVPDMMKVDILRAKLPKAMISTFTYKPQVGILTTTAPNGIVTTFIYDTFNRLKYTIDTNGKTVKENQYHYVNQ